jgi:hypothetical protein
MTVLGIYPLQDTYIEALILSFVFVKSVHRKREAEGNTIENIDFTHGLSQYRDHL